MLDTQTTLSFPLSCPSNKDPVSPDHRTVRYIRKGNVDLVVIGKRSCSLELLSFANATVRPFVTVRRGQLIMSG